jgi:multiple sugar transport system permease protein
MTVDWRLRFVAPMVLALATVVLFPTLHLFWMSTQRWVITSPPRRFAGLDNFARLLGRDDFWQAMGVTGLYLALSTALMLGLALGLALAFRESGGGLMRALVVMPLVIPPVVAGFTWRFLLNGESGVLGAWLLPMAGFQANLLADPNTALLSVVLADVWSRTPFMFLIFLAALQAIPRDLHEAARMDGAGPVQDFLFVTLPMLRGAIFVAVLFRLVDAINSFELIFVMTRGGPGRATQVLSLFGWEIAFQELDFGTAAALGVVMLAIATAGATLMFRRYQKAEEGMQR